MGSAKATSYDRSFAANPYKRMLWGLEQDALTSILAFLPRTGPLTHLDFACGTGRILAFMRQRGLESTGIDISPDMLNLARGKNPDAEFILGDISRHDVLEARMFDLITAFRFFPNAEPELRCSVMRSLVAHLTPGGILVFNNHRHDNSLLYRLARFSHRGGDGGMSMREAEELVAANGLVVKKIYHAGILPITEDHVRIPIFVARMIERMAMGLPLSRRLSQDLIYVCTKRK